jgi:hypothetical protein
MWGIRISAFTTAVRGSRGEAVSVVSAKRVELAAIDRVKGRPGIEERIRVVILDCILRCVLTLPANAQSATETTK